jgi:uncharacterized membrane protein YhaH (DUF805 family)
VAALAAVLLGAPDALAHGIVGREDLPIPRWLFGWAATAVLVVSFVALATLWPTARLEKARERDVLRVPAALEVLCGVLGIAIFALVVWAGLTGAQSQTANIAPTFIFVIFWVGIPVASLLLGDVFRAFNPWRALGRGVGWLAKRVAPASLPEPVAYPARLGRWPAVIGLFAFVWLELAYATPQDPSTLAVLALVYAAVQLVGMSLYGVGPWSRDGDAFGVYFGLFGAISPLHWHDRRLALRPVFSRLTELRQIPGTVALLAVAIGSTTFDGMRENQFWTDAALDVQRSLEDVGLNATQGLEVAYTLGLLAVIGLAALLYWLGVVGMRSVDPSHGRLALARQFAHSLVPIAFAYVLAHYFSFLAYQGQAVAFLASDPRGDGSDILGTAGSTIDYTVVSANGIWYVQVGALVLGHVAGLVLAHDRALVVFKDPKRATRSQYWMLAVMVAFTSLGLWLLSSANS